MRHLKGMLSTHSGDSVVQKLSEFKQTLRESCKCTDGIVEPVPASKMRERERRATRMAIRMITKFLADGEFASSCTRMAWGTTALSVRAVAVGRLFSLVARLADGLPTAPDSPPTPFSEICTTTTFLQLQNDADAYARGVAASIDARQQQFVRWTLNDEIFHFARGVEAFLSGYVTVFNEADIVTRHEVAELPATEMRKESDLVGGEAAFASVAACVEQYGFGIIRNGSAKDRSRVLASHVFFHVHRLHEALSGDVQPPPAQRQRTDTMAEDDETLRLAEALAHQSRHGEGASSHSAHPSVAAFATNRPLTTEASDEVGAVANVYQTTAIEDAQFKLHKDQYILMKQAIDDAEATNGGVATHLVHLEPAPAVAPAVAPVVAPAVEPEVEPEVEYRKRAAASGAAMHVIIDLRTATKVLEDEDEDEDAGRLHTMDQLYEPEGIRYVLSAPTKPPSELWMQMQTVLKEVASNSTAAEFDERFDAKVRHLGDAGEAQLLGQQPPNDGRSWNVRSANERVLLPIAKGQANTIYQWNNRWAPADEFAPRVNAAKDARDFIGSWVSPLKNAGAGATQRKGPSRRKGQTGPVPNPVAVPLASLTQSQTKMLIRAPNWNFVGLSRKQAIDLINQYSFAAKHDVGAYTSTFLIFDMSRLFDTDQWRESTNFVRAGRGNPSTVLGQLRPPSRPEGKYGVLMVVERLQNETDELLEKTDVVSHGLKSKLFEPKRFIDGCQQISSIDGCEAVDGVHKVMVALWKLLAKMSSIGFVFLDFHMGNVMFNERPTDGSYQAKLVDIDVKLGTILSPVEVKGVSVLSQKQGWKPLLILNSLVVATLLSFDLRRARLLQKWMNSDRESLESALNGAVYDIGHANRFKKMVNEVADAALAIPDNERSVPLKLLSFAWHGGCLGEGTNNLAETYRNPLLIVDAAAEQDAFMRMKAALQVVLHNSTILGPRITIEAQFRQRQKMLKDLAARAPGFRDIVHGRKTNETLGELDIDRIRARYHNEHEMQSVAQAETFLRYRIFRSFGPLMRHFGKRRSTSIPCIELLAKFVFENATQHEPLFQDKSALRALMPPIGQGDTATGDTAAYDAAVNAAVSVLVQYDDQTAKGEAGVSTSGVSS